MHGQLRLLRRQWQRPLLRRRRGPVHRQLRHVYGIGNCVQLRPRRRRVQWQLRCLYRLGNRLLLQRRRQPVYGRLRCMHGFGDGVQLRGVRDGRCVHGLPILLGLRNELLLLRRLRGSPLLRGLHERRV
jgi:hypothetical protein